jgi:hypothetical protein
LLEDVRDPIWVCAELQRVAKAGYIEVPSRILEKCLGVENPTYAGYVHHRWLVDISGNRIAFFMKPHDLHSLKAAIVARIGATQQLNPRYEIASLEWSGSFDYGETMLFAESEIERNLVEFAARSRRLSELLVSRCQRAALPQRRRPRGFTRVRNSKVIWMGCWVGRTPAPTSISRVPSTSPTESSPRK